MFPGTSHIVLPINDWLKKKMEKFHSLNSKWNVCVTVLYFNYVGHKSKHDSFLPTDILAIFSVSDLAGGGWTRRSIGPSMVTPPNIGIIGVGVWWDAMLLAEGVLVWWWWWWWLWWSVFDLFFDFLGPLSCWTAKRREVMMAYRVVYVHFLKSFIENENIIDMTFSFLFFCAIHFGNFQVLM